MAAAAFVMLLVHAAMVVVLLWTDSERHDRKPLRPLEVTLLAPRPAEPPKAPPPPPRPKPVVRTVETPKPEVAPPPIAPPEPQEAAVASESPAIPVEAAPPPPVIEPPRFDFAYLNNPKPAYPPIAKRLKLQGVVVVSVFVNAKGLPERVKLEKSSGVPVLDEAALEAVRHWTFVPARRGDVLIADWVNVPLNFRLQSTDGKG